MGSQGAALAPSESISESPSTSESLYVQDRPKRPSRPSNAQDIRVYGGQHSERHPSQCGPHDTTLETSPSVLPPHPTPSTVIWG